MNPIYRFYLAGEEKYFDFYRSLQKGFYNIATGEFTPNNNYRCFKIYLAQGAYNIYKDYYKQTGFGFLSFKDDVLVSVTWGEGLTISDDVGMSLGINIFVGSGNPPQGYSKYTEEDLRTFKLRGIFGEPINPNYKDDLSKDTDIETNQHFYRNKLSGKISLIDSDFYKVHNASFGTEFFFNIHKSNDNGKSWESDYFYGKFMKTDCQWDLDNKKVTLKVDTHDNYNKVLAGLEKEYDLIQLAPALNPVVLRKRPLTQMYIQGESTLSCFISGSWWEQSCEVITDHNALTRTYHFSLASQLREVNVTGSGNFDVTGLYGGKDGEYTKYPNTYYIKFNKVEHPWINVNVFVIYRTSDDKALYQSNVIYNDPNISGEVKFTPVPNSGATGEFKGETTPYNVYARYLLDREYLDPYDMYDVPSEDITDNNLNYRKCIGLLTDSAFMNLETSVAPTKYGRRDDGTYYHPPYSWTGQDFYPIGKSKWRYSSLWFKFNSNDWIFEPQGRMPYKLKDCFDLASSIQVLLNQFAPDIKHESKSEYSQFLYSDRNPISGRSFELLLSQKSNLLHGSLAQPAQKASITLQDIFKMLKDCFRCYWFIDDQRRLRIEHIEWFRRGGSYGGIEQYDVDLTKFKNIRNDKYWDFGSNSWEFDKVDMPERFQFKWMDDCTKTFEGVPIEVLSKYVTPGKIEDINVSKFTPDVDYMLMNPSDISQDGFALFAAVKENALPIGHPSWMFHSGIIASDGSVKSSTSGGEGQGWIYAKCDSIPGETYIFKDRYGNQINSGVYYHFYNLRGQSLGRASQTNGRVTIPDNCYTLGISLRSESNANPTSFPVIDFYDIGTLECQALSLPFVGLSGFASETVMQNGYLSWNQLQPNYYIYDLPARSVKINDSEVHVMGVDRKKKQTVKFPTLDDINTIKLIKTKLGSGQIDKISVNLHSRMNKVTLKYDTE